VAESLSPLSASALDDLDSRFYVKVRRLGGPRPWHAFVAQGFGCVGEPGSTTYAATSPERSFRRAMRTVSRLAADRHLARFTVRIEVEEDGWR
jgi:hypothetical protein